MTTGSACPPAPFVPLWLPELRLAAAAQTSWLWQGYLAPGNITLLTSQWKAGKTTLVALLLHQMKAGGQLAGFPVQPGQAAVVSEESAALWLQRSQKFDYSSHVCWFCRPFLGNPTPQRWQDLVDQIGTLHRNLTLHLLVIDPLAVFLPGRGENQLATMIDFLSSLRPLTSAGLAVLLLHHPRKEGGADGLSARGHGSLSGFVDVLLEMHWYGQAGSADRRRQLLAWSRFDETPRQRVIELNADGSDYTCLGDLAEAAVADLQPPLYLILQNAAYKLTRQEILDLWPPDGHKPAPTVLWSWLEKAVGSERSSRSRPFSACAAFASWHGRTRFTPGAMHTRFEHSLGVMHVATRLYDAVVQRSRGFLAQELGYNDAGFQRDRMLVRLTALLHDTGHGPFSHAGEDLLPDKPDGKGKYVHEEYSAAVIRARLREAVENHLLNRNFGFRAEDVTNLLEGRAEAGHTLFWRELITGQMDADRMDYLLRDSLHAGVDYGRFDWRRLVHTVEAVPGSEEQGPRLGVSEGGWHTAEALVLARYFMFTQVYFHKTRVAFDFHLRQALSELLPGRRFPTPQGADLEESLRWDDWRVLGMLADRKGGDHGRRLAERDHYREVYHTSDTPSAEDFEELARVRQLLGNLIQMEESAQKSWYKVGQADIPVAEQKKDRKVKPLSAYSTVVKNLRPIERIMVYARKEDADLIQDKLTALARGEQ